MDSELILNTVSRVVHVGTAITLVGGSVFTLLVLMPSAKELPDAEHEQLAAAIKSPLVSAKVPSRSKITVFMRPLRHNRAAGCNPWQSKLIATDVAGAVSAAKK